VKYADCDFVDVSFDRGIITVSNQLYYDATGYRLLPPKCNNISSIHLNGVAVTILQQQKQKHSSKPEDFVFYDYRGEPFRKDGYLKYNFQKALDNAKKMGYIPPEKNITFHSLRHTYASMLVYLNENIFTVQHLLRHKDFRLTYNTYAHMYPDKKPSSFATIDNEFGFLYNEEDDEDD